ncbi:hypothetical protein [Streptococcus pneumoniae]
MEQLHFITKLLDIKDPNIQILDIINKDTTDLMRRKKVAHEVRGFVSYI